MTISLQNFYTSNQMPVPALTPIQNETAQAMVYGALQAYEYYLDAGMDKEAQDAKEFLLGLHAKYTFSDGYTQKTLEDFYSINSNSAFKTWWDGLKSTGLISTDPSQPKLSLMDWTEANNGNFSIDQLSGGQYLNIPNFTLYSNMFFLQVEKDNAVSSDLTKTIDDYFSQNQDGYANAAALCLQIYNDCGKPEPDGSSQWDLFTAEIDKLLIGHKDANTGMYANLIAICSGIPPFPYDSFKAFFADVQSGKIVPTTSSWSIWGIYESDPFHILKDDYRKLEADLRSNNLSAAVQDYQKILKAKPVKGHEEEVKALAAAAKTWAESICMQDNLIIHVDVTGDGGGAKGILGSKITDGKGNIVTLDAYLNNPDLSVQVNLPNYFYDWDHKGGGTINKLDGTEIAVTSWQTHGESVLPDLNKAFNNKITWTDTDQYRGNFDFVAHGTVADLMNAGNAYYEDTTGGAASKTAADTIAQILGKTHAEVKGVIS